VPQDLIGSLAEKFFKGEYGELHIDSRNIKKGDAFLALPGEHTHGNNYVDQALKRGASLIIVDAHYPYSHAEVAIAVSQPEKFLWKLSKAILHLSTAKRIVITGSNGKTTTKDLVALALGGEGKHVLKTRGNYNNQLGTPLTLCRLRHHHKFAIIEIGTNAVGEIKALTKLTKPDIAVLTSINAAHMQGLKNIHVIAEEKSDIFRFMKAKGICFLKQKEFKLNAVRSALKDKQVNLVDFNPVESKLSFVKHKMTWTYNHIVFSLTTPARHNVENAQVAIQVALACGEPIEHVSRRLEKWTPSNHRMCVLNWRKRTLIDDCYNANPASMIAAVESALNLKRRREQKILLAMADMKEMGVSSARIHSQLGRSLAKLGIDVLLTMGDEAFKTLSSFDKAGGESSKHCESKEEMSALLTSLSRPHDIVLIKGSRGMHLEEVVKRLNPKMESIV